MFEVTHAALFVGAAALVLAASARLAAVFTEDPLERIVTAASIAGTILVLESLALGLVNLGSEPEAIALAAFLVWAAARLTPPPRPSLHEQLTQAVVAVGRRGRMALGGLAALVLVLLVRAEWAPPLDYDSAVYHLPEAITWIQSGSFGSVERLHPQVAVGYQQLGGELQLSWAMGLARSFAPLPLISLALFGLLGAAGWLGLRVLAVEPRVRALALGAMLAWPTLAIWANGTKNDIGAAAWLAAAAALTAAARSRPALIGPALLALGLAWGTKATTIVIGAALLLAGGWAMRVELRRPSATSLACGAVALAIGGVWYLRNLVANGSPLWPYVALPGGRPAPGLFEGAARLIETPLDTVAATAPLSVYYVGLMPLLVIAGLALTLMLEPTKPVVACAVIGFIGLAAWSIAPFTGVAPGAGVGLTYAAVANVRYAAPALIVLILGLALASRSPGPGGLVARAALWLALIADLGALAFTHLDMGIPVVAPWYWLLVGILIAIVVALSVGRAIRVWLTRPGFRVSLSVAAALALIGGLAAAGPGWPVRASPVDLLGSPALLRFMDQQPDWRTGVRPIAVGPLLYAPLAGPRLTHPLRLLTAANLCDSVEAAGWTVLNTAPDPESPLPRSHPCLDDLAPAFEAPGSTVFVGGG